LRITLILRFAKNLLEHLIDWLAFGGKRDNPNRRPLPPIVVIDF
jgi:hypothetical protein